MNTILQPTGRKPPPWTRSPAPVYFFRVYRAALKVSIASMAQYRFAILIWAVWGFIGPLVSLAVWTAASSSHGGSVANGATGATFSQRDFAAYFLIYMIFAHLTMSWDAFEFAYRVRDGNLSPKLLKPLNPIHGDAAVNVTFKLLTSVMLMPVWVALFIIMRPTAPANWWGPLAAVPALLLAGVMRFVWNYSLATIAFWTTRVEAINQLYFSLDGFLSGRFAPLALLPGWLGAAAVYLPFASMGSFPVELALGRVAPYQVASGFGRQVIWLVIGILVYRRLWKAGVRQYSAVGA